jgi:hypothetical protein
MPAALRADDLRLGPCGPINGEDPAVSGWNRMKKKWHLPATKRAGSGYYSQQPDKVSVNVAFTLTMPGLHAKK